MKKKEIRAILKTLQEQYLYFCNLGMTYSASDIRKEIEYWEERLKNYEEERVQKHEKVSI